MDLFFIGGEEYYLPFTLAVLFGQQVSHLYFLQVSLRQTKKKSHYNFFVCLICQSKCTKRHTGIPDKIFCAYFPSFDSLAHANDKDHQENNNQAACCNGSPYPPVYLPQRRLTLCRTWLSQEKRQKQKRRRINPSRGK